MRVTQVGGFYPGEQHNLSQQQGPQFGPQAPSLFRAHPGLGYAPAPGYPGHVHENQSDREGMDQEDPNFPEQNQNWFGYDENVPHGWNPAMGPPNPYALPYYQPYHLPPYSYPQYPYNQYHQPHPPRQRPGQLPHIQQPGQGTPGGQNVPTQTHQQQPAPVVNPAQTVVNGGQQQNLNQGTKNQVASQQQQAASNQPAAQQTQPEERGNQSTQPANVAVNPPAQAPAQAPQPAQQQMNVVQPQASKAQQPTQAPVAQTKQTQSTQNATQQPKAPSPQPVAHDSSFLIKWVVVHGRF